MSESLSEPVETSSPPKAQIGSNEDVSTSSVSALREEALFRVRLINIDHSMVSPGPFDRISTSPFNAQGTPFRQVPVIRVYGATPAGQRVCLHIHDVFPYVYIEYKGKLDPQHVLQYISRLGRLLNDAVNKALKIKHFVVAIHLCKGVPIYGYHVGWKYFLKISFINPSLNNSIRRVLESPLPIEGSPFQAYECHIRYQLQFMLDYNVFGCGFINLENVAFRNPLPDISDSHSVPSSSATSSAMKSVKVWNSETVPVHLMAPEHIGRSSHCAIEVDASAAWILNRQELRSRSIHQDFDVPNRSGEFEKVVPSLSDLWEENRQRRMKSGLSATMPPPPTVPAGRTYEQHGQQPFAEKVDRRYAEALDSRVKRDIHPNGNRPESFVKDGSFDADICTTFESVDLFHGRKPRAPSSSLPSSVQAQSAATSSLQHGYSTLFYPDPSLESRTEDAVLPEATLQEAADSDDSFSAYFSSQHFLDSIDALDAAEARAVRGEPDSTLAQGGLESDVVDPNHEVAEAKSVQPVQGQPASTSGLFQADPITPSKRKELQSSNGHATPSPTFASRSMRTSVLTPVLSPHSSASSPSNSPSAKRLRATQQFTELHSTDDLARSPILKSSLSGRTAGNSGIEKSRGVRFASQTTGSADHKGSSTDLGMSDSSSQSREVQSVSVMSSTISLPISQQQHDGRTFTFCVSAPARVDLQDLFVTYNLPTTEHQPPYYSNPVDVPDRPFVYGGKRFKLRSKTLKSLPLFSHGRQPSTNSFVVRVPSYCVWEYGPPPPTRSQVSSWQSRNGASDRERLRLRQMRMVSQVEAKTQKASFGFKISQHEGTALVEKEKQHMTILAIEILACNLTADPELLPDPARDPISLVSYCFLNEDEGLNDNGSLPGMRVGIIMLRTDNFDPSRLGIPDLAVEVVDEELDLINAVVDRVRDFDPEIFAGWELHNGSWGYLKDRAMKHFEFDIVSLLGRLRTDDDESFGGTVGGSEEWNRTKTSLLSFSGRHTLNVWRLMRGEINLNQYTLENVVYHLLRRRVPKFSQQTLAEWYTSSTPEMVRRAIRYVVSIPELVIEIIEKSEMVFRTAEFARIYGIDFFSVISRGSQFRVESVMLRIGKPESFVFVSPDATQVASQNAAEGTPLIEEPQSAFYTSPVLVLDFQSLYPSVMIAYNLCFSTCLGRIDRFKGEYKLGFTNHRLPDGLIAFLKEKDAITVNPRGIMFVKPDIRKSLLARMLTEILDTRVMIKESMKGAKHDKPFQRLQNARQLSLKLLANVTYGYTSATFSGRMSCVEIADSIVDFGRRTLEEAIQLIKETPAWGAQVVYGDTDSLFVHLPGRSKDEAFRIGNEIADAVTATNPKPVKLKFEKVYLPCVLMAKKRYVGYKYESSDDLEPVFDAKGIETVRRDGFPAMQRMLESSLRILFETHDVSAVKDYCQRQWRKILEGKVSPQDFTYAKEVRLGGYKESAVPPPGAVVAALKAQRDRRAEPQHAERVPYIITQGITGDKLNSLAVPPEEMLAHRTRLRIHANYYIDRIVASLERVFNLLGSSVSSWRDEMTVDHRVAPMIMDIEDVAAIDGTKANKAKNALTLTEHFRIEKCSICEQPSQKLLCCDCAQDPHSAVYSSLIHLQQIEQRHEAVTRLCASCALLPRHEHVPCISLDCPIIYTRSQLPHQLQQARLLLQHLEVEYEVSKPFQ